MKFSLTMLFVFLCFSLNAQDKKNSFIGFFSDYFGDELEIKADYTYHATHRFDLESSWTKGTWTMKNDTIYFKTVMVYDTLRHKDSKGKIIDEFIRSDDEMADLILEGNQFMNGLISGGQDPKICPPKLYYSNRRLYKIDEHGKLLKTKIRGIWSTKKNPNWYIKESVR